MSSFASSSPSEIVIDLQGTFNPFPSPSSSEADLKWVDDSSEDDPKWIHDVFLSFRGEDTRDKFVSHLHSALSNAGIKTFIDYEKYDITVGQRLEQKLATAIEGSKISIVVFSERYGGSTWCLNELQKIMNCHRTIGQVVVPIFYDVDPSDVRRQNGAFGKHFKDIERKYKRQGTEVFSRSKMALTDAANMAGWDLRNWRNESEAVKEIVENILIKLDNTNLPITNFPVGLDSRVQDVIQFLKRRSTEVCIVGIWGMGGIGKTTIAKAIYNKIHHKFEDRSFLENIREVWEKDRGKIDLQQQLLLDILRTRKMKIHNIEWGKAIIKDRLCSKRALLVLDDVNKFEQLNALCGNRKSVGPGSVIIVTTRDVRLLHVLKVDHIYRMMEMDKNESLELFSCHAFMVKSPAKDFIELSKSVVAYCGGLPLALEVLGSYLYERTKQEWESALSKLERIPNDQIQEKLKISFDGLKDHMEKDIFLDICCFFINMDRAYVTQILNGCGFHAEIGIAVLIERSLIKVEKNNKLGMHALLRDMGREIIRESSPKELEKRSRLWFYEDVLNVLTEHTGTKAIEGLALKLQGTGGVCFSTNAFEEMKRLRLLQLDDVQLDGDYECLPKNLRWICWQGFPLEYIPGKFYQRNLVAIDLKHSNLKLVWKEPELLERLKILNLSHSRYLTNSPDFSKLPNLEQLILEDCPGLSKLHQSIGDLSNILLINLKDCKRLNNLPRMIYKLKSLKTLTISGCSNIDKLEEDIVQMESLTTLIAKNTAVKQVPFSIVRAKSLGYISLCGYEGLTREVFPSLIWSWMSPTINPLPCVDPCGGMSSSLVSLDVQNNSLGDLSSMLSSLSKLRSVRVQCQSEFQLTQDLRRILDDVYDVNFIELETTSYASRISEHSLRSLLIGMGSYHHVNNTLSKNISQGLTANGSGDFFLPGDNYPYWLTHTGEGHSVLFEVPQDCNCGMKGMALCVVYSSSPGNTAAECLISVLIANYTKCTIQLYKRDTVISFNDEEWQGIISNLEPGDKVGIFVALMQGFTPKKTAVYLIYGDEPIDVKVEPSPKPKKNAFKRFIKKMQLCCFKPE